MSFLGTRNAVSIGVSQHLAMGGPNLLNKLSPSLLLNFAGAETLDPRITFTRATTATFTGSNGLIQTAVIDAPRFDYNPTTLAPLGLLIEEQRTNLVLYSEQFDDAAWVKLSATVTANQIVAPDGTTTGDYMNTTAAFQGIRQSPGIGTTTANAPYALSVYVKPVSGASTVILALNDVTSANSVRVTYTLSGAGSFGSATIGGTATLVSRDIQAVGNGWYRCVLVGTVNTTWLFGSLLSSTATSTVQGIWGAQLEAGAFPTSYIQTVASQVTRSADVAVMTGTNFSDWYNAAEGTLYAEWNSVGSLSDSRIVYALSNGTFNNVNYLTAATASASNQSVNTIRSSNTTQAITAVPGAYTNYTYRKTAAVYKVNDFALSGDGSAVVVDTSGLLPVGVDRLALGTSWTAASNFINGHISQIAFYPRRLANSELQAITS
jgi:hypothetical protein